MLLSNYMVLVTTNKHDHLQISMIDVVLLLARCFIKASLYELSYC